ncbi:MAG TPA: histidine kinase, partial [Archangium sp.]|nr:histidine kinase [Archangium sp.]
MTVDASGMQALRRVKRKNYFVCVALLVGGFVAHALAAGAFTPAFVLTYVGWISSFLGIGVAVGAGWIPVKSTGLWAAPVSLAAATTLIHLTGGPFSPSFPMLSAVPFAIAIFTPDTRRPTVLAFVGMLAAVGVLDVLAGLPPGELLAHGVSFGLIGAIAIAGSHTYRRMSDAEKTAQQERLVAQQERLVVLEQLAESERRRMKAERERVEVDR